MPKRLFVVRALIALGALAGMALSRALWKTHPAYPRVPLFDFIPALPVPLDSLFLLAFAAAIAFLACRPRSRPVATFWILAMVFLALQDQSRMQPWFVEYMLLLAAVVFSESDSTALNACCLVLAAVYFWSGVHKMNGAFVDGLFPWLTSPLPKTGLTAAIPYIGVLVPYLEMAMGLALVFPRTRRAGVVAAIGTHLFLFAMLGPWALNYNSVVWPWNLTMIALTPCLFWTSKFSAKEILRPGRTAIRLALFTFVIVLPPLSLAGLWDTYLAFALYSGNPLSGTVLLTPSAWERLDTPTRAAAQHVGDSYRIYFREWSLATLNVPEYPAERVLRRIAQSFCAVHETEGDVIFVLDNPAQWLYRHGWQRIERTRDLCQ